ncbi:hypothetical protein LOK49_LG10G01479 [Camellia lanceoleosa]|uniref:Uncharacterized protein n=1 Tax=Camellia lanceoleosa TaxID=1840588 RepID=A0ACC0GA88_9ERIC|nr:hypothetical protein LOK49_LG10G01479 [Camellia lanceoleosa]
MFQQTRGKRLLQLTDETCLVLERQFFSSQLGRSRLKKERQSDGIPTAVQLLLAMGQSLETWQVDSGSNLHPGHWLSLVMLRWKRLSLVPSFWCAANQMK